MDQLINQTVGQQTHYDLQYPERSFCHHSKQFLWIQQNSTERVVSQRPYREAERKPVRLNAYHYRLYASNGDDVPSRPRWNCATWHPVRVAGCSPHENGDGQPESPPPRSCLSRCHLRQWTWTTSQVTSTFLTTRCPSRRKQLWSTQGVERPYWCWPTFHSICLSPAQPVAAARCWPTA